MRALESGYTLEHRWPFGKIDGSGKWNNPHLSQGSPSIFGANQPNRTPMPFEAGHSVELFEQRPSETQRRSVALSVR